MKPKICLASSIFLLVLFSSGTIAQTTYTLRSPNQRIEVTIHAADHLSYDVTLAGQPLLKDATLALKLERTTLGTKPKVKTTKERTVDQQIEPAVPQKFAKIREHYNELRLDLEGQFAVVFRAYDEGVGYRFETALAPPQIKIQNEEANFNFAGDYSVYYPKEESFFSHNEREFLYLPLKNIAADAIASLPAVIDTKSGVKLALADSDVEDYPGLWLRGNGNNSLSAIFPPYPLKEELTRDRDFKVTQPAEYIAATRGTRTFPWRILSVAEKDADLITNQMVYLLAQPSQVQDTSWIKPGKVAWDWYNANNLYGVDFKAGINTQTYKYYIDFAAKYGLEYIILDEGWYKLGNVLEVVPEMNIEELVAYGKQRNVGIILWVVWKTLDDQFDQAFAQYEKWGVKGLKID